MRHSPGDPYWATDLELSIRVSNFEHLRLVTGTFSFFCLIKLSLPNLILTSRFQLLFSKYGLSRLKQNNKSTENELEFLKKRQIDPFCDRHISQKHQIRAQFRLSQSKEKKEKKKRGKSDKESFQQNSV